MLGSLARPNGVVVKVSAGMANQEVAGSNLTGDICRKWQYPAILQNYHSKLSITIYKEWLLFYIVYILILYTLQLAVK